MKHHPEQRDDEIYMGNWLPEEASKTDWKSWRFGTTLLRCDGDPLKQTNLQPAFIQVAEVQRKIASVLSEGKPWSAETARTLQPMVDQRTCFCETPERSPHPVTALSSDR